MRRFASLVLITLLTLGWALPSWADKVATPLMFDNPGLTAVLSIYKTTAETQADGAKALLKASRSFYKPTPGFERLALFNSTDGARLASLTLWQDATSYEAFQASLTTAGAEDYTKYYEKFVKERPGGSASLMEPPEPLFTATLTLDQVSAPPSLSPVSVGENALVQIIGLRAKASDDQAILTATAQATLKDLPSLYPAPRAALLLSATDTPYLALLANWGYVTEFGDISQLPPISIAALPLATAPDPSVQGGDNQGEDGKGDLAISPSPDALALPQQNQAEAMPPEDWLALDNHLYQLVKVIAPKVNKYEGGVD
jgi:heme-degrading monooxygenase HmoA